MNVHEKTVSPCGAVCVIMSYTAAGCRRGHHEEGKELAMRISIAIVDDLAEDRARLNSAIAHWFASRPDMESAVYVYPGAEEMLAAQQPVQIAFLDIRMQGLSGIALARRLRLLDEKILLVFLSSSAEYAFDAFPVHPFDYLLKPCADEAVAHVLDEALRVLSTAEPTVLIRVARAEHQVPLSRITAAVSQGHSVEITLTGGETLRSILTFSELESLLGKDPRFLICNRGVLVNMDHVLALDGDLLRMQDGSVFPLRTRGRAELTARFTQYQISRLKGGRT